MNLKSIRALAFDFWGVFAEIDPPMNLYAEKHGVSLEKYSKEIHDLIIQHDLDKITEKQFLDKCSKIIDLELPYLVCSYRYSPRQLNGHLVSIIRKLKPKYKIGLLSNNNREYSKEFIFKSGLISLFDVTVLSYEEGYRKPSPEMYQILVKRLEMKPSEILYIDDESSKLLSARDLGMQTLVYKGKETEMFLTHLF